MFKLNLILRLITVTNNKEMEEIKSILVIWFFAYVIEYFKSELDISMFNVLIFINLIAVFYLLRDLKFSVTLEINNYTGEDDEGEEEEENVN